MAKGFNSRGFGGKGMGGMGGMGGGMNMNMMKQVQKMQQDMAKMQEELAAKTYTAQAGGGAVTAEVNGQHQLLGVTIDPDVLDPDDVEMLQDLVVSAANEALRQAGDAMDQAMDNITGGLNLGNLGL